MSEKEEQARYIYCIVKRPGNFDPKSDGEVGVEVGGEDDGDCGGDYGYRTDAKEDLGQIGIEKNSVFAINCHDLTALVHSCPPKAYDTRDQAVAEAWIIEHSFVIDQAMKKFPSVLPFSFDVILKGDDTAVAQWLERNREALDRDLERLEGRAEYGIQIYYDNNRLTESILAGEPELQSLKSRIDRESRGKAYLLQKKLDQTVKALAAKRAAELAASTLAEIKSLSDELKVDEKRRKPEAFKALTLLASYTCLVKSEAVEAIGKKLDEINRLEGFTVRFTGPWAPFSFVSCRELS